MYNNKKSIIVKLLSLRYDKMYLITYTFHVCYVIDRPEVPKLFTVRPIFEYLSFILAIHYILMTCIIIYNTNYLVLNTNTFICIAYNHI